LVKNIVVIGWGQIAELLCEHENVVGYVNAENFDNIIDVNTGKIVRKVNPNTDFGVIGIGKSYYKELRSNQWIGRGYKLGVLIHPTAYVSPNAKIDEGSVVMPLAFVDDKSSVGKCSIVGPQSALRVATVGNYCHLSIQTKILPHSKIEDYVFIGSGAAILEHIVVGKSSIIGANSTVSKNIPSNHIYLEKVKNVYLRENTISYPLTEEEKK
jgi:acetyltransferase-like isoleucine patch superfamily enzyme